MSGKKAYCYIVINCFVYNISVIEVGDVKSDGRRIQHYMYINGKKIRYKLINEIFLYLNFSGLNNT